MTNNQSALSVLIGEVLADPDLAHSDVFRRMLQAGMQDLVEAEAAVKIGAGRYERSTERTTRRNGTRAKTLATPAGEVELAIPKLLAPLGDTLLAALRGGIGRVQGGEVTTSLGVMQIFALSAAALLGSHLVLTLIKAAWRTSHRRARHRQVLNLLTKESPANPGTLVLDHETPVAYCLPGFNGSITVLSRGLLQRLNADELRAVLAHEGAHLTQRHDLLVLAFVSWNGALPWLPTSRLSLGAVQELVEMLADDAALQHVTRPVLLRALLTATSGTIAGDSGPREPAASTPVDTGGAPAQELSARRLRRLLAPQPSLPAALQALILCAALLLLAIPTALVIAP